jgi:hypothetical protein
MEKQEMAQMMKAMLTEMNANNETMLANSQELLLATINAN